MHIAEWKQACTHLRTADTTFGEAMDAVDQVRPLKPLQRKQGGLYAAIARTICGQQLSVAAANTIWQRVEHAHGKARPQAWLTLDHEALRACGLSRAKARAITGVAEAFVNKTLGLDNFRVGSYEIL